MKRRTALVTGATGFVGSHVVGRLARDGWNVHSLVRPTSPLERLPALQDPLAVHRSDGSVESIRSIVSDVKPDVVFHLAALFVSDHRPEDVTRLIQSNVLFGAALLEGLHRAGVRRMVNTGTSWQHFEDREYDPANLYAASKQAFESLLEYYVRACGLQVVTLQLFDTYGPGDPRGKFIELLLHAARSGTPLAASPGEQSIDLVHVEDAADAFVRAADLLLDDDGSGHRHFAVSSGEPITLRELAARLEAALGVAVPVAWGARNHRPREVMRPWRRGVPLPGWKAGISLDDGLRGLRWPS